jgi:hypothetical protein
MTSKKSTLSTEEDMTQIKCPYNISLPCVPDPDSVCKTCKWLFMEQAEEVRGTIMYKIKCLWQEKEKITFMSSVKNGD